MNNTANKKDIFYIIVLILTFITVIVGATFAIYSFVTEQKKGVSAVYTGTFTAQYLNGDIIGGVDLYPRSKPNLEETHNVYKNTFKISNTGTLDGRIDKIVLEIYDNYFETKRLENEEKVKKGEKANINIILYYSLYDKEKVEIATGKIGGYEIKPKEQGASEVTIASNSEAMKIESNTTEEYTLLIWLHDDGELQDDYKGKEFYAKIKAVLYQEEKFQKK